MRPTSAAAQQCSVTRLECQPEGIHGDIGAALVDHADHAQGDALLAQLQPVGQGIATQHFTDRIAQSRDLPQPGGDTVDSLRVQGQPVQHGGRGVRLARRVQVFGVGRQDLVAVSQ